MKILKIIAFFMLSCIHLMPQGIGGVADKKEEPYLVVTYVEGTAQIRSKDSSWRKVEIGDVLQKDDIIRTATKSEVRLTITKGGEIYLKEQSVLIFESHIYDPVFKTEETIIKLRAGKVRIKRDKMNSVSKFYLITPYQSNLITGTDFVVSVGAKTSTVSVFSGEVLSANTASLGEPVSVTAGKKSVTGAGIPPSKPEDIGEDLYIEWNALSLKNATEATGATQSSSTTASPTQASNSEEGEKDEEIKWKKVDESGEESVDKSEDEDESKSGEAQSEKKNEKDETEIAKTEEEAKTNEDTQGNEEAEEEKEKKERPKRRRAAVEGEKWEFKFNFGGGLGIAIIDDDITNTGPLPTTWISAFITPQFDFGPLAFGLYLPVYLPISLDIYKPTAWHNFAEWDFGTRVSSSEKPADIFSDIFVKFFFIEFKERFRIFSIWARYGSLDEITLGSGYLMNKYVNALNFPSVRKNGLYIDLDFDVGAAEFFLDDLTTPFWAFRVYSRPMSFLSWKWDYEEGSPPEQSLDENTRALLSKLEVGFSFIYHSDDFIGSVSYTTNISTNTNVATNVSATTNSVVSNIRSIGIDISWTVLSNKIATVVPFFDWGTTALNSEFDYANGLAVGARGQVAVVPYRAEFRFNGEGHFPELYDKLYYEDSVREKRANIIYGTSNAPSLGFFIESGVNIKGVSVLLNFAQNFEIEEPHDKTGNKLHFEVDIPENIIKNFNARLTYDRTDVIATNFFVIPDEDYPSRNQFNMFDLSTIVMVGVTYKILGKVGLNLSYTRSFGLAGAGDDDYDEGELKPINSFDFSVSFGM